MSFTFGWKPFVMNPTLNLKRKVLLEFMFTERFVGVVNNSVVNNVSEDSEYVGEVNAMKATTQATTSAIKEVTSTLSDTT